LALQAGTAPRTIESRLAAHPGHEDGS